MGAGSRSEHLPDAAAGRRRGAAHRPTKVPRTHTGAEQSTQRFGLRKAILQGRLTHAAPAPTNPKAVSATTSLVDGHIQGPPRDKMCEDRPSVTRTPWASSLLRERPPGPRAAAIPCGRDRRCRRRPLLCGPRGTFPPEIAPVYLAEVKTRSQTLKCRQWLHLNHPAVSL